MNRNIPPALANQGVGLKSILFVVALFFVIVLVRPESAYAVNWETLQILVQINKTFNLTLDTQLV
jgi:hypothetical protein